MMGMRNLITGPYHPMDNGGTEHVNHTLAWSLSMVVDEHQNDWDEQLTH